MVEPDYLLTNTAAETATRFAGLEETFDPVTIRHLSRVVAPGNRCLELGAGGGSVARWIADAVGPSGSVLATDLDVRWLAGEAAPFEVLQHDLRHDPDPRGPVGSHPRTPRPRPPADPAGGARSPRRGVGPRWLARARGLRHRRGPHDRSAEPGLRAHRPGGGRVQRPPAQPRRGDELRRRCSPSHGGTWSRGRRLERARRLRCRRDRVRTRASPPTPARSRPSSSPVASLPTTSIATSRPSMTRAT